MQEFLKLSPARESWDADRQAMSARLAQIDAILAEWAAVKRAESDHKAWKPKVDKLHTYKTTTMDTLEGWWKGEGTNYSAALNGLNALKTMVPALQAVDGADTASIRFAWIDRLLASLRTDWGNAQVDAARASLKSMRESISTLTGDSAAVALKQISDHLALIGANALSPSATAAERQAMIAEATEIAQTVRNRENLDAVVRQMREAQANGDWARVRDLAEQVTKVLDSATVPDSDAVRAEATRCWKRAGWYINLRAGDKAWTAALQGTDDMTPAERRDLWATAAGAYTELLDTSMWAADGYPNDYTVLPPWEHTRDPQGEYDKWNEVMIRGTLAPAWHGYWSALIHYDEAVAAYRENPQARDRSLFDQCMAEYGVALKVLQNFPEEFERTEEIRHAIERADIAPSALDAEAAANRGQSQLADSQWGAAVASFKQAIALLKSVIKQHEQRVPEDVPADRELMTSIEAGLAEASRMAEEHKLEDLLENGNQREANLLQQFDRRVALDEVAEGVQSLLSDYRAASDNAKASPLTRRVFKSRVERVQVVQLLVLGAMAFGANDKRNAIDAWQQADTVSGPWPDLGARARIGLHKATADDRAAYHRRTLVRIDGGAVTAHGPEGDHGVNVESFLMDRTEVTNADYAAFLTWLESVNFDDSSVRHPDQPGSVDPRHIPRFWNVRGRSDEPVVGVSYWDAAADARWAGKSLPTSDEWEWAASNGGETVWPWGNEPDTTDRANALGTGVVVPVTAMPDGNTQSGLAHMAGNVMEWTDTASTKDGRPMQLCKGGSFNSTLAGLLTDVWFLRSPGHYDDRTGFRCVMRD